MLAAPENRLSAHDYKRLLRLLMARPANLFVAIFLTLVSSALTACAPRVLGYIIDELNQPHSLMRLKNLVLVYAALELGRLLSSWGQSLHFQFLGQAVLQKLRMLVFTHILALPCSTLDRLHSADIGTRLSSDLSAIGALFSAGFVRVIERICIIGAIMLSLLLVDPFLGGCCLAISLVSAIVSISLGKHLSSAYRQIRLKVSAFSTFMSERIGGLLSIHLFNAELRETEKAEALSRQLAELRYKPAWLFGCLHALSTVTIAANVSFLLVVGGARVSSGAITLGALLTLVSYVLWILWPLISILNDWHVFITGTASAKRIFELLDEPQECGLAGAAAGLTVRGELRFENVNFSYSPGTPVLHDISVTIPAGAKVALVGATGSGKSTFVSLLLGLYQPDSGSIFLDNHNLHSLPKRHLRQLLGLVHQDIFLFSGTVRDNLTLWRDRQPYAPILDISLNAPVSEHGANFSVGERQALAFARTATGDPSVWLIDEATASLDPQTEAILLQELRSLSAGKTSISIAHRLRTIIDSDIILVFSAGRIVERGNHADLLKHNGLYARLYALQVELERAESNASLL